MSNSSKPRKEPRIKRGTGPRQKLRPHNYRERALPFLLADFAERCAYSMQHVSRPGLRSMEVDHFNPKLPARTRNSYKNLFLATRHCNNSKRQHWPSPTQQGRGLRFLNCCEEQDYGEHIFEDRETHRVVGVSPPGRYHIRMCDLNAPHFIKERRDRSTLLRILTQNRAMIRDLSLAMEIVNLVKLLSGIASRMIPPIPPPAAKQKSVA
jgi:hypothetical protein